MAPTILVVGATGNTGRSVVETLSKLLPTISTLAGHRILALTRSKDSPAAQPLSSLPGVEVEQHNWPETTAAWLRSHQVVRAFIASHNAPNQFAEESQFHLEALHAGVKYVVRISTTAPNVRPDSRAYYPRSHWAIEQLLSSPEFEALHFTSLQPNFFTTFLADTVADFIQQYRKTGEQGTLRLIIDRDAPIGIVDPDDVGAFAAHLLAQDDTSAHNGARHILNGPEDITGRQVAEIVNGYIGVEVKDVRYKDVSFIEQWADAETKEAKNIIRSICYAPVCSWEGKTKAETTSQAVLDLAPPKGTFAATLRRKVEG